MAQLIYFADDEKNIRDLIEVFLKQDGYDVEVFPEGESLLRACTARRPDLVVVDIMMPGKDGLTVCQTLRDTDPELLIIIVSAKDSPYDRVRGFASGSDDYLVKPFLPLELVFRIKALLKRKEVPASAASSANEAFSFQSLRMYPARRRVELDDREFALTPNEFDFLLYMVKNQDRAVSREELLKEIWQMDWETDTRAADDLVKRIRRKLRERGSAVYIETVWGYGFRLTKRETTEERG